MNKKKWNNPNVPIEILALKLSEEAAEVGIEISDASLTSSGNPWARKSQREMLRARQQQILTEIEHVEFLCGVIRERIVLDY